MKKTQEVRSFLDQGIWQVDLATVEGPRRYLYHFLRSFIIAWRDFRKDSCQQKASALTFYTLLSIVPIVAMFFGIAKGFGFEKKLESQFKSDLTYNQEVISYVFEFANSMLQNTKGGLIAGLGVALLFWSVMKVLGSVEASFNDIWEARSGRSWVRKFTDYMAIMLVSPLLIIVSSSIHGAVSSGFESASENFTILAELGILVKYGLELLSLFLLVTMFGMLYIILPNTKVKFPAALFGGLVAAILFLAVEYVYLTFQVGVSRYNAIYGGFAALPLFLAWVQTNWLVVLLGAELSFAYQNHGKFEFDVVSNEISQSYQFVLSVAVVHELISKFEKGEEGPSSSEISAGMQIPAKLVRRILNDLVRARVVNKVIHDANVESKYYPAVDISKLDLNFVLRRLNDYGVNDLPVEKSDELIRIEKIIEKARKEVEESNYNLLIKDM